MVVHQAIRALLLPPLQEPTGEEAAGQHGLDDSQEEAAHWEEGPLLVDAGPGTGKTRTLIHRVTHILARDPSPASILALTFSNKAAEEMRSRLAISHADAAIEMWVGTIHAFGMELIAKWADRVGRTDAFDTLDEAGQLALLEKHLTKLPLRYYQNLYEPAFELVHVLRAISRCKDELVGPAEYLAQAEQALSEATDEQRENAERAVEIAHIYKIYDELLVAENAVDFGDLVSLSVRLLEENPDILQDCHQKFAHILVDEYQDVNLASARLLQLLVNEKRDIWVVADQRQSIYRFRGAKPSNVSRFAQDFGGARRSLATNYRSGGPIVRTFGLFSHHMASDSGTGFSWHPARGDLGNVSLTICSDVASEAAAIRDNIERLREQGIAYRDQAILARSRLTLSRITGVLEKLNVPLLYLGDLFERDEIRDLLSLLAIDVEYGNIGLARVAQLPEYGASKKGAETVISWARDNDFTIFEALRRVDQIDGLPERDKTGFTTLGMQLDGMNEHTSPWTLLTTWLLERSAYLNPLVSSNDAVAQQQRIAIYQFLKVCADAAGEKTLTRKSLLDRIRRAGLLGQDHAFRIVSSEASDFDGIRVLTLHGSKGLEFRAVHLPGIATRYMPASRQWNRCPPPAGLSHLAMNSEDHDAEEECLFFVGLSRARDHLSLSRAEKYKTQTAKPSKFLPHIQATVTSTRAPVFSYQEPAPPLYPPAPREIYTERELDLYRRCPARYRYEMVEGLVGSGEASAYLRFHRCVYRTMGWIAQVIQDGRQPVTIQALDHLAEEWETSGLRGHGFEAYYRAHAELMIAGAVKLAKRESGTYELEEWSVPLGPKKVTLTPDRVAVQPDGSVHIQRFRTGRRKKSEPDDPVYALLRKGAASRYSTAVSVETYYPALDESVPTSSAKDTKGLQEYQDAIAGIEKGDFTKKVNAYCPSCPCYFICGA